MNMLENHKRQRFYQGQNVAPRHLNELQDYADQGQANLIASLLGYGIVNGFEISHVEGHTINVTAGLAFNLAGERLVLAESKQVNLSELRPTIEEKTIKLGIIFDYIKTDPVLDSMGNMEHAKWTPTVEFIIVDSSIGFEASRMVFELAEIKINPVSIITITNTAPKFTTLPQQIQDTSAFSTEISSEKTIANINGDIININKKSFADTIRDMTYPVKSAYTQYPNDTTGFFDETETPKVLFGGDWELVATKIFNNVPTEITNEFGTSFIYPDGRLEFIARVSGFANDTSVTFPYPFIALPKVITEWVLDNIGSRTLGQDASTTGVGVYKITNISYIADSNRHPYYSTQQATGYWKTPIDSITADEEKDYVKIWKRI